MLSRVTGEQPRVYGSIVGFGEYQYKYASGGEGTAAAAAFAARKPTTVITCLKE